MKNGKQIVDTLKDFQTDKITGQATRVDKKYIRSVANELKKYGFAYIANSKKLQDEIKELYPNAVFSKVDIMVEVSIS